MRVTVTATDRAGAKATATVTATVAGDPLARPGWGAGTNLLDPKWWAVWNETYLSYDWAYILAKQAVFTPGELTLTATRRATAIVKADGKSRWWDVPYLKSAGLFERRHGRWEVTATLPPSGSHPQGLWPAFWFRVTGGLPGEIDLMESYYGPHVRTRPAYLNGTSDFTVHESTNGGMAKAGYTIEDVVNGRKAAGHDSWGTRHTWVLEKTAARIACLFDGKTAAVLTPASHPWAFGPTFAGPLEMRLNVQVGDNYWTPSPLPRAGEAPATVRVHSIVYNEETP